MITLKNSFLIRNGMYVIVNDYLLMNQCSKIQVDILKNVEFCYFEY